MLVALLSGVEPDRPPAHIQIDSSAQVLLSGVNPTDANFQTGDIRAMQDYLVPGCYISLLTDAVFF